MSRRSSLGTSFVILVANLAVFAAMLAIYATIAAAQQKPPKVGQPPQMQDRDRDRDRDDRDRDRDRYRERHRHHDNGILHELLREDR